MAATSGKRLSILLLASVTLGVLVGFAAYKALDLQSAKPDVPGFLWPHPKALTAFELQNQHAKAFNLEHLKTKWSFLFFGYSHCPDVCPTTLSVMSDVQKTLARLDDGANDVQFIFISLDPQRDTPEHLAKFAAGFNKEFIVLTGEQARLDTLTKQFAVMYQRSAADASGNYEIKHTDAIMLTGPKAQLIASFGLPHQADVIASRFLKIRQFSDNQSRIARTSRME